MSIAPIVRSVVVKAEPAKAFELFTTRMQDWWPLGNATIGPQPAVAVVLEPRVDGRWFERDAQGHETSWGKVLTWQIGTDWAYHPELLTELELTFAAQPTGGTLVTLEHRHLERLGAQAARHRDMLDGGWPTMLGEFQKLSDSN
jgi:uncharacterized protein YndB with AHSA1/START domain